MRRQKLEPIPSKQAEKYLNKLDDKARNKLKDSIINIPDGDIRPYDSNPPYFRLIVRHNKVSYRVIFKWISDEQICILKIKPRGDAYKGV